MKHREQFMYDVRVRDRFVAEGAVSKADVERHLASLADLADACEDLDLEQPALSKEPDTVSAADVAPAPVAAVNSAFGSYAAEAQRAPIPAIADAGSSAAHTPTTVTTFDPVPAIAQESQAPAAAGASEAGPASAPPPTASVDADWGDS